MGDFHKKIDNLNMANPKMISFALHIMAIKICLKNKNFKLLIDKFSYAVKLKLFKLKACIGNMLYAIRRPTAYPSHFEFI